MEGTNLQNEIAANFHIDRNGAFFRHNLSSQIWLKVEICKNLISAKFHIGSDWRSSIFADINGHKISNVSQFAKINKWINKYGK